MIVFLLSISFVGIGKGYDCFAHRFPVLFGGPNGDSEITAFETDGTSGFFYAGWTQDSSLKENCATSPASATSAFWGKHDGTKIIWQKKPDCSNDWEKVTKMSSLDASNFIMLLTSQSGPHILLKVSKSSGDIQNARVYSFASMNYINSLIASASSPSIYLPYVKNDNSEMGVIKLDQSFNIEWFLKNDGATAGHVVDLQEMLYLAQDYQYFSGVIHETSVSKIFSYLGHFDDSGNQHWVISKEQTDAFITSSNVWESASLEISGSTMLWSRHLTQGTIIRYSTMQLSSSSHSTLPVEIGHFEVSGSDTLRIQNSNFGQSSSEFFSLVNDLTNQLFVLYKFDTTNNLFYKTPIQFGSGSNFMINKLKDGFYFGHITSTSDGVKSKTWSNKQGFVMVGTTTSDNSCMSFTHDWSPTTGGQALTASTTSQFSQRTDFLDSLQTSGLSLGSVTSSSTVDINPQKSTEDQIWCQRSFDITVSPSSDLGSSFTYISTDTEIKTYFSDFVLSDTSCDSFQWNYQLKTTRQSDSSDFSGQFPTVQRDATGSYISMQSTDDTFLGSLDSVLTTVLPDGTLTDQTGPTSTQAENTFSTTVLSHCALKSISVPSSISQLDYKVSSPLSKVPLSLQEMQSTDPNCPITYTIEYNGAVVDGTITNLFYHPSSTSPNLMIGTDQNTDSGTYVITVKAENDWSLHNSQTIQYNVNLVIEPECSNDPLAAPSTLISDINYKVLDPQYQQTWQDFTYTQYCPPISYTLTPDTQGMVQIDTTTDPSSFKIIVEKNLNVDMWLQYKTYSMTITAQNKDGATAQQTFDVIIERNCLQATLVNAGAYQNRNYIVDQSGQIDLKPFTTNDAKCPIKYKLYFKSNDQELPYSWSLTNFLYKQSDQNAYSRQYKILTNDNNDEGQIQLYAVGSNDKTDLNNSPVTQDTFTLTIHPNCEKETVSISGTQADIEYIIKSGSQLHILNAMATSRAYCTISYSILIDGQAPDPVLFSFDNNTRTLTINNDDNFYGNKQFSVQITGVNFGGISNSYTFNVNTKKDCQYATVSSTLFGKESQCYHYMITMNMMQIDHQKFISSDPNCEIDYDLLYKRENETDADLRPYEKFIVGYTEDLTHRFIQVYSTDNEHQGNYSIRIVGKIRVSDNGKDIRYLDGLLEVITLCQRTLISVPVASNQLNYFVGDQQIEYSTLKFSTSWVDSTYTPAQLEQICGALNYRLYVDPGNYLYLQYDTWDTEIFSIDFDSDPTQLFMNISTSDPYKADKYWLYKRYDLVIVAQQGPNWQKRGYHKITVYVNDYCWQTKILQNPNFETIKNQEMRLKDEVRYNISEMIDKISYRSPMDQSAIVYYDKCGKKKYVAQSIDGSQLPNFIGFSPSERTFFFYPKEKSHLKIFFIKLIVSFENFADYPSQQFPFKITVSRCKILKLLTPSPDKVFKYNILGGPSQNRIPMIYSFIPKCDYIMEFESMQEDGNALPDFLIFDNRTLTYFINLQNEEDLKLVGNIYKIKIYTKIRDHSIDPPLMEWQDDSVKWDLELYYKPYIPPNTAPTLNYEFSNFNLYLGDNHEFKTGLPSNDTVKVEVSSSNERLFNFCKIETNNETLETKFAFNPKSQSDIGTYKITLTITDGDYPDEEPMKTSYSFFLNVLLMRVEDAVSKYQKNHNQNINSGSNQQSYDPPVMKAKTFNMKGQLFFEFDQIMTPKNITKFGGVEKVLSIEVIPGIDQNVSFIGIKSFEIEEFTKSNMIIQVFFETPLQISIGYTPDQLSVQVLNTSFFVSEKNVPIEAKRTRFNIQLPRQMIVGTYANALEGGAVLMKGVLLGNFALNLAMTSSINMMWGLINTLQITLHLSALNVYIPSNAQFVNTILVTITQFELIPEEYLEKAYFWKKFIVSNQTRILQENSEVIEKQNNLNLSGYQSHLIIENLGSVFIFIMGILGLIGFVILIFFLKRISKFVQRIFDFICRYLFWNSLIRFFFEIYLELVISAHINLADFDLQNLSLHEKLSKYATVASLILVYCLPFVYTKFLLKNKHMIIEVKGLFDAKLDDQENVGKLIEFNRKYSSLWYGLRVQYVSSLLFNVLFLIRRFCMAVIIVLLDTHSFFQIQFIILLTQFMIIYLNYSRPYISQSQTKLEISNEVINMMIMYHFIIFSDFVQDEQIKYQFGWGKIGLICLLVVTNICIMFKHTIKGMCSKYRKRKMRKRYESQINHYKEIMKLNKERLERYRNKEIEQDLCKKNDGVLRFHTDVKRSDSQGQTYNRFANRLKLAIQKENNLSFGQKKKKALSIISEEKKSVTSDSSAEERKSNSENQNKIVPLEQSLTPIKSKGKFTFNNKVTA